MRPALMDALASNGHIVTDLSAGAQTVICCTKSGVTVTWGNGPYGDLGYGATAKSSAKPKFVATMDSCLVSKVVSGYGHTVFLIRNEDKEDKEALKKLDSVEKEDVEEFDSASLQLHQQKKDLRESGPVIAEEVERTLGKRKLADGSKGAKKIKN